MTLRLTLRQRIEKGKAMEDLFEEYLKMHGIRYVRITDNRDGADFIIFIRGIIVYVEVKNHADHYYSTRGMTLRNVISRFKDTEGVKVLVGCYKPSIKSRILLKKHGVIDFSNMPFSSLLMLFYILMFMFRGRYVFFGSGFLPLRLVWRLKVRLRRVWRGLSGSFGLVRNIFRFLKTGGCGRLMGDLRIMHYILTDKEWGNVFLGCVEGDYS
jgi:hypothetical protein